MGHQYRFDSQPQEVGYTEVRPGLNKTGTLRLGIGTCGMMCLKISDLQVPLSSLGLQECSFPSCQCLAFPSCLNMMQSLFCSTRCNSLKIYPGCSQAARPVNQVMYNITLARKVWGLMKGKRNCILEVSQDSASMLGQSFCQHVAQPEGSSVC